MKPDGMTYTAAIKRAIGNGLYTTRDDIAGRWNRDFKLTYTAHADWSKMAHCGNYRYIIVRMCHTDVEGIGLLRYFNLSLERHAIGSCRFFIA